MRLSRERLSREATNTGFRIEILEVARLVVEPRGRKLAIRTRETKRVDGWAGIWHDGGDAGRRGPLSAVVWVRSPREGGRAPAKLRGAVRDG